NKQYVIMDAPPDKEDIRPFIKIANKLIELELSSPKIIAFDLEHGLMLLEDLGDNLFAKVIEQYPEKELELYSHAIQVLIELYQKSENDKLSDIPLFDNEKMLKQVSLLTEWFLPLASGIDNNQGLASEYIDIWQEILDKMPEIKKVMVLYDYHAENIIWLPERDSAKKCGLLDFQDAMLGLPVYDLVSILEDVRRDVSQETVEKSISYYLKATQINQEDFMLAYKIMGAQRNCRIAGTFARLAVRDKKPRYLEFMPRVWKHIENDVSHPMLAPLKFWLDKNIKPEWRGLLNK
ncbi:MAG: phosphotransferase, partial [Pseudomonadota bacterium]